MKGMEVHILDKICIFNVTIMREIYCGVATNTTQAYKVLTLALEVNIYNFVCICYPNYMADF